MSNRPRIVIVSATSAIAEHCARHWVGEGPVDLVLVGRDAARVERVAADLRVRGPGATVEVIASDFLDPAKIRATVDHIAGKPIDTVLIAQGSLPDQITCQNDLQLCRDTLAINGLSPVLFAEAFAGHMEKANRGTLAIIGSVAGDRGRKSNYVYGSAKGMVERYAQGLQHRLASTPVKVVLIKPGPTDTPMTAGMKAQGLKVAPVEQVADQARQAVRRGAAIAYVPGKWRIIMRVIQHLPTIIFNKVNI